MRYLAVLASRGPLLMSIFPFTKDNVFDKPANMPVTKPLEDELGWDRVKKIFRLDEHGLLTKEFQSIINVTISGILIGGVLGGVRATKNTIDNFVGSNEATRFTCEFDAKKHLQQEVSVNFIKKGSRVAGKLGLFCFMISTFTTCTTAYRGKLAVENYIFGGAVTGLLFKMNLGGRAAMVGTGLGGVLGGICGTLSVLILKLSGVTIDEVLTAQQEWVNSRDQDLRDKIKVSLNTELPELQEMYEANREARSSTAQQDHKT